MARRNSSSGCLIVVVVGLAALGWVAQQLSTPEARTAWLTVGATTVGVVVTVKLLRRALRKRALMAKYGDAEIVRRILAGITWQGETEAQLVDALGKPDDVDEKVLKQRTTRTFKYGRTRKNRYRLRVAVEEGVVVGWEQKG